MQLKQQFALDMQHVLCLALIWRLVSVLSCLKYVEFVKCWLDIKIKLDLSLELDN